MASLQERDGRWQCQFFHEGKRRTFSLGKVTKAEAEAKAAHVDYLLMRLEQGLIPLTGDIITFVRFDGVVPDRPRSEPTLADLRDRYLETHTASLEHHTVRGIKRHFAHLCRVLGAGFPIRKLALSDLQGYVDKRAKEKGRRGTLNPATIKKEIVSLRTAWNWAVRMKIVAGRYPYDGLRYPKTDEKPRFMTRAEIERQLPGLTRAKQAELWESLHLTLPEIERLLLHVRDNALHPWIYPLVATAAHTGARKGELLRMRIADVDFEAGVVTIKERKRAHDRRTTRQVPISTALASILKEWLADHPGGDLLFAAPEMVAGSKKRSLTTGHLSKDRPGKMSERLANVRERERPGLLPITEEEAHYHLKQTLKGSEWEVVKGYHVLRHGFLSACASRGIDQRYIDEWAGHSTEEQRRRYRHLAPNLQSEKLKSVFG
jgi:integrase